MIPSMCLESAEGPGDVGPESKQRWRVLDDPVAIRALAHPLRNDLMRVIGRLGRATTADAARELGISHGLASHHLHQLKKYGFIEKVEGKDNRERPWRLVATSYDYGQAYTAPGGTDAIDVLERVHAENALNGFLGWQRRRQDWPPEWREYSGIARTTVYLTQDEVAGLATAMEALLRRYTDERPLDDVAARPAGSLPVDVTIFIAPAS
jgi:DNA-binding transcriptional ArsR family regulator